MRVLAASFRHIILLQCSRTIVKLVGQKNVKRPLRRGLAGWQLAGVPIHDSRVRPDVTCSAGIFASGRAQVVGVLDSKLAASLLSG